MFGDTWRALAEQGSRRVYHPVYGLSRAARPHLRSAYRAYVEGMRFRAMSRSWSGDRRQAWMLERLRLVVRRAGQTTPYYQELFARVGFDPRSDFTFEDYALLPVLDRETVRTAGDALITRAIPRSQLLQDRTGGSTGTPTVVWKGPEELGWGESASTNFLRSLGLPPGGRMALLWGHNLDTSARADWRTRLRERLENVRWYDCFRLSPEVLRSYAADLQRWRPRGLIAYASAVSALAEEMARTGDVSRYPTTAIVTGAEKLFATQRERIRAVFTCPIAERYGGRDFGQIAFQLDSENTLDFSVDWAASFVEPESTEEISDLLVTKLRADGMPMLRYRVGDMARFPASARPGTPAFTLHEVVGRDVSRLWLPDGRWMHGVGIPHLFKDFPVRDFQVTQDADLSVQILVVPADGYRDDDGREIGRVLSMNLPGVEIVVQCVSDIARTAANKWSPVVSRARKPAEAAHV